MRKEEKMTKIDKRIEQIISKRFSTQGDFTLLQMDEFSWLQYKRKQTQKELKRCKGRIKKSYQSISEATSIPTSKWGILAMVMEKGASIMKGIQIGYRVGDAIKTFANIKNLFKKKR